MFTVGLTGGIGSGKTTVAKIFEEKGITIIDTDQIAKELTQPNTVAFNTIINYFGNNLLTETKTLDRKKLKEIIFNQVEKKNWLEKLLHPLIRREVQVRLAESTSLYSIVVIPLLFETENYPMIQRTLVIDTEESLQLQRVASRDHLSLDAIQKIMHSQVSRGVRLALADDIIYNNGDKEALLTQVEKYHNLYLQFALKKG